LTIIFTRISGWIWGREEEERRSGKEMEGARKSGMEGGETLERRFSDFSAAFSFY